MEELQQERIYGLLDQLALAWLDLRTSSKPAQVVEKEVTFTPPVKLGSEVGRQPNPKANEEVVANGQPVGGVPEWESKEIFAGEWWVRLSEVYGKLNVSDTYLHGLRKQGLVEMRQFGKTYWLRGAVANRLAAIAATKPDNRKLTSAWITHELKAGGR